MTVIFVLLAVIFVIICGASYFVYRIAFYSPKKGRDQTPATTGVQYDPYREVMGLIFRNLAEKPFQRVTIRSWDGLELSGRYYHIADGAPVAIGFHGYRSAALTDFSGGAELSFSLGQNLLLVDQRAHGQSQGSTITFGVKERYDCLDWIDYVQKRFGKDTQILLYGISMGAATVLMASDLELPWSVKGIIADCPYSSPCAIIETVSDQMRIPHALARPFVKLAARLYGGFDIEEADAVRAVRNTTVPVLLIHGEKDSFVPCAMSEEVYLSNPKMVQRHTFPGADHGISYLVDRERYSKIVTEFIASVLE